VSRRDGQRLALVRRMLIEEFRLHAELFGRNRFLAFPLFIAAIVAGSVWLLARTDTSTDLILAGLHALVFVFGMQVGTIGLAGRDAMRDLLGDVTLLVFSARTLPVSRTRLLGVFVVTDVVYYLAFVLTPVVVGFLPVVVTGGLSPTRLPLLWVTITTTFALGIATTLALAGVATRSTLAVAAVVAVIAAGVVTAPQASIGLTPYAVYADPTAANAAVAGAVLAGGLLAGLLLFEPSSAGGVRRIEGDRYRQLRDALGSHAARSLLEVTRSSGSVWKVGFSLGVLFGVTALLLDRVAAATTIQPSGGIAFGTLLGLGTFTTYNWVTQADDPREYLQYPGDLGAMYAGKRRAFLALSVPFGLVYLAVAAVWYPLADLAIGLVVFPLVSLYVFGLTAYLTGLSANELLFDTALFAVYGACLAAVAVPLLVAALAFGTAPVVASALAVGLSALAAGVGAVLARRCGPRWHDRLRTAS
jgi:hypothetical protein